MKFLKFLIFSLSIFVAVSAGALEFGLNLHRGGGSTLGNSQFSSIMLERNLRHSRMDLITGDEWEFPLIRDMITKVKANGGRPELAVQNSWHFDRSCNPNLAWVEQDSYDQTYRLVDTMKDLVDDYEMMNEVQLRSDFTAEVKMGSAGWVTSVYDGKPCIATLTAALRGMSRAIKAQGKNVIMGEVGPDYGFLTWLQQKGVVFDIVGFHTYPYMTSPSLAAAGAKEGYEQLSKYNKPIRINEFNCGEIYNAGYENQAGGTWTETCLKSLARHLKELRTQTYANIQTVHIYEMVDHPTWNAPENRFGLMYDPAKPKVHLYLVTAFSGGTLSSSERNELISRGLLTDAEIDAMQQSATPTPTPTPIPIPIPTTRDTASPSVSITSPLNGAVLKRGQLFWVSVSASDNVSVKNVRMSFNGASCVDTTTPYVCKFTAPWYSRWTGTINVIATDAAGNTARASSRVYTK